MNWKNLESAIDNWLQEVPIPGHLESLHYVWFASHVCTLLGTLMYLAKVFGSQQTLPELYFWYCFTDITALATYAIVTYRRYLYVISSHWQQRRRISTTDSQSQTDDQLFTTNIPFSEVLKTENAQLLAFAVLWLNTEPSLVKILPFTIYSFLNLSNYLLNDIFPDFQISSAISPLIVYLENPLLLTASHLDCLICIVLVREWHVNGKAYPLVFYQLVWALRIECSEASRCSLYSFLTVVDYLILQDYNPQMLKRWWSNVREVITILAPLTKLDHEDTASIYNYIEQFLPGADPEEDKQ